MTNIPTDLLRTFISVVDLRSFTRAARAQGMTQPAVSAQIRRLQGLLGVDLLDKSAPGVSLTPIGGQVIDIARRMLSINDRILEVANPNSTTQLMRVGVPSDCMGAELATMLAASRARWPHLRFTVQGAGQRRLLQWLKQDEIDLVLALITEEPEGTARHYWTEQLTWVRGKSTTLDPHLPVPLVSYSDHCVCHHIGVASLDQIGRASDLVFRASSAEALRSAVAAGVGVMVVPRRRIPADLDAWDDGPLPALPPVFCGVFVREGMANDTLDELADHLAQTLRPPGMRREAIQFASPRSPPSVVPPQL
jgi:DNA-binding transcriptional LysR family regulator